MDTSSIDSDRLSLNEESEMEIELRTVGEQKYPLAIIDNLYADPHYVRELALSLPSEPMQTSHPGVKTKLETDITALHHLAWKYVGQEFGYTPELTVSRSLFPGMAFTRIHRKPEDLTIHQCRPHADPVRIAGIVYLNLPEQCRGGTAFYRHRASGVEECVLPKQQNDRFEQQFMEFAKQRGVFRSYRRFCQEKFPMPYKDFVRTILTTMPRVKNFPTDSDEDWVMTAIAEMKFNRLVCYPGFLLHSGYHRYEWFGDSVEQQRLTQNLFVS